MQAVVLVGGQGTRLRSVVSNVPKPMAPVNGRPFIEIIFDQLIKYGINDVVLAAGYLGDQFVKVYSNHYKSLRIQISLEKEPLLTGGAVKSALKYIDDERPFFILNGDTYIDLDYKDIFDKFIKENSKLMMVIKHVDNTDRYGSVIVDACGRVLDFTEKKTLSQPGFINTGVLITTANVIKNVKHEIFSLENDLLKVSDKLYNFCINTYITNGVFIDIGIPTDYFRAQRMFK